MTDRPNTTAIERHGNVVFADSATAEQLGPHLDAILDPLSAGSEKVKKNASRTVFRGVINGQAVYIKHYHSRSLWHRIGRAFGRYDAKHEVAFSRHLTDSGVTTPWALAAQWTGGHQWLVTAAVSPAVAADVWHDQQLLEGPAGRRRIRQVTVALAQLVGRMHAAGVIHGDLHCGNILIRTDTPKLELVLTDLHRTRRARRISRRARAANLAHLFHDRMDFTTRTERFRFLKHYFHASGAEGTLRGWQLMVEHFAMRHRRRLFNQRDRRIQSNNLYFARLRLPNRWRGHVVLASKRHLGGSRAAEETFTVAQWKELLADPSGLLNTDDGEVFKKSRSSLVVRRTIRLGDVNVDVYVKRHQRKRRWKAMLDCFRTSRALRAFRLGHALLTRRIPTALPLAALERRVGPFLVENILITEAIAWPRLDHFLSTWLAPRPTGNSRLSTEQQHQLAQEVLWQMGRLLQRLHDCDFAHRDLKASNMFVRWRLGMSPEIILIDLDGLRRVRRISTRQRFQGLMRLNVSLLKCPAVNNPGQLRMLLGYLRRPGSGHIEFKAYWRVLETWSARKLKQQIRSRRNTQFARRQQATRSATT